MNKPTILLLIILIAYALIREEIHSSPGLPFPDSPKKDIAKSKEITKKPAELDYFRSNPNPVKQPVNPEELDPKYRLLLEPSKKDWEKRK